MVIKGFVELSIENGLELIKNCRFFLDNFKPESKLEKKFFIFKMKWGTIEVKHYPFFYQYKDSLISFLETLENMLKLPDKVYLSLLAYENLLLLSKGDTKANPIFIMNY